MSGTGSAKRIQVDFVPPSMFKVTDSPFILDGPYTEKDDIPRGPMLAVLSERFWKTNFNSDPKVRGFSKEQSRISSQAVREHRPRK
jgi:hypothetical protein